MTQIAVTAADLRPGDRFVTPDPEDTWPVIAAVGDPASSPTAPWPMAVPVTVDGEPEPRLLDPTSTIGIDRPDAAPNPPEPAGTVTP